MPEGEGEDPDEKSDELISPALAELRHFRHAKRSEKHHGNGHLGRAQRHSWLIPRDDATEPNQHHFL